MDHTKEGYQGIVLYVDNCTLRSQIYFPSDKQTFDLDVKRGTLENPACRFQFSNIITSRWLEKPVNRSELSEINTQFYNETLSKLARKARGEN